MRIIRRRFGLDDVSVTDRRGHLFELAATFTWEIPMSTEGQPGLGHLEHISPREAWQNEPRDFTPWLLANASYLEEALGIEVELAANEHPVGAFSLDLIGRDRSNDARLIVENQLEATDHTHLGQIITYAAGTDASTIVWIATDFRDEHRQALDWLNENTGEDLRFFGLRLALVRIGDSPLAPVFEMAAQPNDWQKTVRAATRQPNERGAQYQAFWERFLARLRAEHPTWSRARKGPMSSWFSMSGPVSGTSLNPVFAARRRLRHEIYIDTGEADTNDQLFQQLLDNRAALEAGYGRALVFEELPNRRACRVAEYRDDGDVSDIASHDAYIEWFLDAGQRLRRALAAVEFGLNGLGDGKSA